MAVKHKKTSVNKHFKKIFFYFIFYILIVIAGINIFGDPQTNFRFGILTLLIFFFSLIIFLIFFGQFILPVLNLPERIKAVQQLFLYLLGDHGPAFFIENGELRERRIDRSKNGPGVIILDTASSAVLRTPVKYKGAIGPGIAFTQRNDIIAGIVDLHIQSQSVGPRKEEDPFSPLQKGESTAAYEARMSRKNETLAVTRDGIQICVNVQVRFKLDANPGEGNSAYGYNPNSVEKAIIGQSINFEKPDDNPDRITSWKWYPVNLTIDVLREYISKYTLNEIFPLTKSEINLLDLISTQIKLRLTQSHYYQMDNYGKELNETVFSKEFDLLKKRGIKFIDLSITNLRFPAQIEEELHSRWRTSWLDVANKEKKIVEQEQAIQTLSGQDQALMDYAYGTSKHLGSYPESINLNSKELLISLLKGNLDTISQDPELCSFLGSEYKDISELIDWVRSQGDL
ncbi:MAG: hypothetical protein CVU41_01635 [Chloroflexi bacterium HGW-Chloroflexi-3]|nr:MAG: hypothetical protein CVU41_01635 [Chloroflexi bacterium HGW-Chloroflexi-3]